MRSGYPRSAYDNPSMLDALSGVGPFTPEEVRAMNGPIAHRSSRWLRRKRRATFRRSTLKTVVSSWPALWSVAVLMVLIIVGLAVLAYAVLTKGAAL